MVTLSRFALRQDAGYLRPGGCKTQLSQKCLTSKETRSGVEEGSFQQIYEKYGLSSPILVVSHGTCRSGARYFADSISHQHCTGQQCLFSSPYRSAPHNSMDWNALSSGRHLTGALSLFIVLDGGCSPICHSSACPRNHQKLRLPPIFSRAALWAQCLPPTKPPIEDAFL